MKKWKSIKTISVSAAAWLMAFAASAAAADDAKRVDTTTAMVVYGVSTVFTR